MKIPIFAIIAIFTYTASMAQGTSYKKPKDVDNPPKQTEAKKEQRFSKGELKGPRAKNYPTHRLSASPVVATTPPISNERRMGSARMGPAAKNYKPWQDDRAVSHKLVTQKKRKNLKGPRAKNQKPWDN